jgi:poly(A) polymerase
LELHRLDCLSSHGRLEAYQALTNFLAETPAEQVSPPRLLTGIDLQDMGYVPGPNFQGMLTALEDAQLEGQLQTKEQAILFIRKNYPRPEDGR